MILIVVAAMANLYRHFAALPKPKLFGNSQTHQSLDIIWKF